jgi:hypothetical protein
MRLLVLGSFLVLATLPALGQSNQNPLLDVRVVQARKMEVVGRVGAYPTGSNAISFESTVCNTGSVPIPWMAPMDPDHPMFAFVVARLSNGRLEQVSDRSYIKHGVQAGNSSNCGLCSLPPGPIGSSLGVGCGDVYDVGINAFQFVLGPPDEVNPWLGTWSRTCSHFDRGEPPVAPPLNCDNQRSLTMAQVSLFSPIQHRLVVDDAELDLPGASFFLQCQFVTQGEPEASRGDSLGSRRFTAAFDGETWQLTEAGAFQFGSVLESWSGASVASATNGADDGRVYVAVSVTGPTHGFHHYEYAIHDRDNARGVRAFRVPICRGARVRGIGFHDVDDDPSNDWTVTVRGDEIVFETTANPLRWNTIYNVWFDSDAGPETAGMTLDAFAPGAGAPSIVVTTQAPIGLYNAFLGVGCSRTTPPSLYAEGSPARATLGNASFALASAGNPPGAETMLLTGLGGGGFVLDRCVMWTGAAPRAVSVTRADGSGIARHPMPIPNEPELEGRAIDFQSAVVRPGGILHERVDLSEGLRVRVGDTFPGCP